MNAGPVEWGSGITRSVGAKSVGAKSVGAKGIAYGGALSGTLGRGALLFSAVVHGGLAAAFIGWGEPQATPPQPIPIAIVAVAPSAAPANAADDATASGPPLIAQAPHQPAVPQPNSVEPSPGTAIEEPVPAPGEADPVLEAALPEPVVEPLSDPVVVPLPAPAAKPAEPPAEETIAIERVSEPAAQPGNQPAVPAIVEATGPESASTEPAIEIETEIAPANAAPTAGQTAALPDPASALGTAPDTLETGSAGFAPARYDVAALANPEPEYPWASRRAGEEGRVVLKVEVSASGIVEAIEVADSSGHRRLDEAALAAVRQWRFEPARIGDQTIATTVNVPVTFKLE